MSHKEALIKTVLHFLVQSEINSLIPMNQLVVPYSWISSLFHFLGLIDSSFVSKVVSFILVIFFPILHQIPLFLLNYDVLWVHGVLQDHFFRKMLGKITLSCFFSRVFCCILSRRCSIILFSVRLYFNHKCFWFDSYPKYWLLIITYLA